MWGPATTIFFLLDFVRFCADREAPSNPTAETEENKTGLIPGSILSEHNLLDKIGNKKGTSAQNDVHLFLQTSTH